MADKIRLLDIEIYAHHGTHQAEREIGQKFVIDLEMELDLKRPGGSDNINDTINYVEAFKIVEKATKEKNYHLIEALAEDIARGIVDKFPLERLTVRVKKPHAPIGGIIGRAEVEIHRERSDYLKI